MKTIATAPLAFLFLVGSPVQAASDADVTLIKVEKVTIEQDRIVIIAEAKTRIVLIQGDHDPGHKGAEWMGRPVTWVNVKSDKATFTIKRPDYPSLESAWRMSLQAAEELREGRAVGRIGYYAPDMIIKGNLIDAITGAGYLYPKGK